MLGGRSAIAVWATLSLAVTSLATAQADEVINVYSSRERELTAPLLGVFENLTGIRTNVVNVPQGLVERIGREQARSPADLILTKDLSELVAAKRAGITQPVTNAFLRERMPLSYRDPAGHWFGLTRRARVAIVSRDRVKVDELTYEELGDPEWKGRLCMRSGQHSYNTGLFASLIAHMGNGWTERWLKDIKGNLAVPPGDEDYEQIMQIKAGKCDVAVVYSYHLGQMLNHKRDAAQRAAAQDVRLVFPNSKDRGTHISISGMALTKHARNKESAILLMDFLTSKPAQFIYAQDFYEYPIRDDVAPSPLVRGWGKLNSERLLLSEQVKFEDTARTLVAKIGFDRRD
ncbi:MAG: hypothetical protein RLZ98_3321 [Pseudomonadota bacterium]|jgi:iron(III) transport system substrate-binding protein